MSALGPVHGHLVLQGARAGESMPPPLAQDSTNLHIVFLLPPGNGVAEASPSRRRSGAAGVVCVCVCVVGRGPPGSLPVAHRGRIEAAPCAEAPRARCVQLMPCILVWVRARGILYGAGAT